MSRSVKEMMFFMNVDYINGRFTLSFMLSLYFTVSLLLKFQQNNQHRFEDQICHFISRLSTVELSNSGAPKV
jgi:hypothetical protein